MTQLMVSMLWTACSQIWSPLSQMKCIQLLIWYSASLMPSLRPRYQMLDEQ